MSLLTGVCKQSKNTAIASRHSNTYTSKHFLQDFDLTGSTSEFS